MGNSFRIVPMIGFFVCLSSAAQAHHPVSEAGAAWVEPSAYVETQFETASFDFGTREVGSWQVLSLRAEYPFIPSLSASIHVPFARLSFSDGRSAVGLSDIELSLRYLVYASKHGGAIISTGVGTALPTGVEDDGLGSGHYEASGYLMVSSQLSSRLNIYANGAYKHAIGDSVVISESLFPHNNREFDFSQGVQWFWTPGLWNEVMAREIVSWEDSWGDLMEAGVRGGFRLTDSARLSASLWVPLSGESRTLWRSNLNLAWIFD